MPTPDMPATKRSIAASDLVDTVAHARPLAQQERDHVARLGAQWHLALYDAGLDLTDPDDAATVTAVIGALLEISGHDATCAISTAARTSARAFRTASVKAGS